MVALSCTFCFCYPKRSHSPEPHFKIEIQISLVSLSLFSPSTPPPRIRVLPFHLSRVCFGGEEMAQNSTDFHLPDEILAVIPTDPFDQLDLARKITSMAIASRVSKLDLESGKLRQKVVEKDRLIGELEDRVSQLERRVQEADAGLRLAMEENVKLSRERDMLAQTTKKLSRDLSKLENFKKQLMQSLNEDNSPRPVESVDIGTCNHPIPKTSMWKEEEQVGYAAAKLVSDSTEMGSGLKAAPSNVAQKFLPTPYITQRFTPTATPKSTSTSISPRGYSAAASPKMTSGATSPTQFRIEGKIPYSPWYPSSQQSSAANSPPRGRTLPGRTPRIDGKEFFRQARSRLSYEQFGAFLANIKELNAHRQSREETLKRAEEIFGTDNKDLYLSFQGLLNCNLP